MKEIRIHGRSGQGNKTAAYLLEQAALLSGKFAQALVSLGPVCAQRQITARVQVYQMGLQAERDSGHPDFLILQDHTLLHSLGVTDDLPTTTRVLVNWAQPLGPTSMNGRQIMTIPATCIAREFIGQPVPNTALIAALLTMTEALPMKALEDALATHFRGQDLQRNLKLIRYVAQSVPAGLWNDCGPAQREELSPTSLLH
jgi:pyruvate ferredoxin oxidoreductase gamma subunit